MLDIYDKAIELRECAGAWEPEARLLGNVRADEIIGILDAYDKRIAELEAKVKSQRGRISQLTHGMADERKANNRLLANIEQLKEWNAEALEENNRLDAEADAARQYAHTMDLQNADYGRVVDELARVKAESLRVVADVKQDCVYCGGTDIECIHCYGYGKPVRLERWEEQG